MSDEPIFPPDYSSPVTRHSSLFVLSISAAVWLVASLEGLCADDAPPVEGIPDPGQPGLIATYSDGTRTVTRLEGRPAFRLGPEESPHPQIGAPTFRGRWRGTLFIRRPGTYRFFAEVTGVLSLSINGRAILSADSKTDANPVAATSDTVDLAYGSAPFEATYRKRRPGPGELRVFWQWEDEFRQPLSPTVLFHNTQQAPPELQQWQEVERGRQLVGDLNCTACHTADERTLRQSAVVPAGAPDLDDLGKRVFRGWIYHWLDDPRAFRLSTTMPRLFGKTETDRIDLYAATAYLSSLGGPVRAGAPATARPPSPSDPTKLRPTVAPRLREQPTSRDSGREAFAKTGCIACHRALGESAEDFPALRSTDGLGSKSTPEHLRQYLLHPRAHHSTSRMPDFRLGQQDPALVESIVTYLSADHRDALERLPQARRDSKSRLAAVTRFHALVADEEQRAKFHSLNAAEQWRTLGQAVIQHRGCLTCHALTSLKPKTRPLTVPQWGSHLGSPPPFAAIAGPQNGDTTKHGCLAERPPSPVPDFALTDDDRHAIRQFLAQGTTGPGTNAPTYWAERNLREWGCTACHDRNGNQSTFSRRILDFVPLGSDQQLQDITPPALTAVGEKLRPEWIHAVVAEGRRARPWMDLKMPVFPEEAIEDLSPQLVAADGRHAEYEQPRPKTVTEEQLEAGRMLVGKTGFNCVSCHDIRGLQSTGVRGPDLAGVVQRVRRDWFDRWLLDPQQISPGTRMPSVFFGGKSAAPQYLNGDPPAQRDALWAYLSQGDRLKLPPLDLPPTQFLAEGENPNIVPHDRPLIVRGYMNENGGNRGIALGFSQGTHFAFNAETCQLVTAWRGEFVEMGGWFGNGRGGADSDFNKVLGDVFWRGPQRPFVNIGERPARGKPHTVQYTACWASADDAGFSYRIQADPGQWITVEDRPAPLPHSNFPGLQRSVTLKHVPQQRRVTLCIADQLEADPKPLSLKSPHDDQPPSVNGLSINDAPWIRFHRNGAWWAATVRQGSDELLWTTDERQLSVRFPPRSDKKPLHCTVVLVRLKTESVSPEDLKSLTERLDSSP